MDINRYLTVVCRPFARRPPSRASWPATTVFYDSAVVSQQEHDVPRSREVARQLPPRGETQPRVSQRGGELRFREPRPAVGRGGREVAAEA